MSSENSSNVPLITIGFTCFNAADTIEYAVKSAQEQTWTNIEILIVDDGSKDDSVDVIHKMMEGDDRIRLIELKPNKGTAIARNTIAENANGEFLTFFDDDDISTPDRAEKQYKRIVEYEKKTGADTVYCYCDRQVINHGETNVDHTGYGIGRTAPEPSGNDVADIILWVPGEDHAHTNQMGSGTMMLRTASFKKTGYFDPQFRRSAELDLAVRAALNGGHFISVPEYLLIQYKTPTTDKSGRKPLDFALTLRRKYKDYLSERWVYWAAIALAYAKFYGTQKNAFMSRLYLLFACLCSPDKILMNRLKKRFSKSS